MLKPEQIYMQAHNAGNAAVSQAKIAPMVVSEHANPLDDNSPIRRQWYVEDGVCGFASVIVKPANSRFAKFLIGEGLARKHYYGGVSMSVHAYNQSLQKKEAYANAFARVLSDNGIRCYVDIRMD